MNTDLQRMDREIEPFHAISISVLAHKLQTEGRSVIHMEFGQPSTSAPTAALEAAHQALDTDSLGYWESVPLKERLSRHYRDLYGLEIERDRFILTSGASAALVLALLTRFSPGDRIAFVRPGYVAYRNSVKALHMVPVEIPSGPDRRFQLTAEALEALDTPPQGIIVASPANPTGTIIEKQALADIVDVCKSRGIQIISDEIYHGIQYTKSTHSVLEFDPSAHVVNSFSKYFSMPGWRLGWLVAPPEQLERARALVGNLFLSASSLSQHAALAALDSREELEGYLETYRRNRERLIAALPAMGLPIVAPPDGAFYLYIDVSHLTNDSLAFCKEMLQEAGVAIAPGIDFDPVEGNRFIRISFAVSVQETETAIERLTAWLQERRANGG